MIPSADEPDAKRERGFRKLAIMLGVLALIYVGSYVVLRQQKHLVRITFLSGTADPWHYHFIETGGAVEDTSKRRWSLWIAYWPLHRLGSWVRCWLEPLPGVE